MELPTLEECREVAARIWCDPFYRNVVMDVKAVEEIARILFSVVQKQSNMDANK